MSDATAEGGGCDASERMMSWFQSHGGSTSKLRLVDDGGELGLSLVTSESISKGEVVMSIPISLCITMESAKASDLEPVLRSCPELMDAPDEVLALHLMREKLKGKESFWEDYIRTLPATVDTPLRWIVEEREEVSLLDGTMVGLLSRMMSAQVAKDWEQVHLPLIEAFPELLGGVTFEDYLWALSSIWSRAFDYIAKGPDGNVRSRRAMVPVINAANHDPSAGGSLAEMIEVDTEALVVQETGDGVIKSETELGSGRRSDQRGMLRLRAGRSYETQEQLYVLYGRYSNAKLLYSYGFVLRENPFGAVDYWVKVPPADPGFSWKKALLDANSLTAVQTYDFSGTLRVGGWVSPALLATARVAQLTPQERPKAPNAFRGKIVSVRNEAAALAALLTGLKRKLSAQRSSPDGEKELVARLEAQHREQRQARAASQGGDRGSDRELEPELKLWRELVAARVRLEEKVVIGDAIVALEESLRQLQSTYIAGDDAASAARFRPLDAPSD